MTKLPINLADLLRQRTVEGERIEYKTGWNPDAIIRALCAFANDFENLGGGYVVIGQDRYNQSAQVDYLSKPWMQVFLQEVDSALATDAPNFLPKHWGGR